MDTAGVYKCLLCPDEHYMCHKKKYEFFLEVLLECQF